MTEDAVKQAQKAMRDAAARGESWVGSISPRHVFEQPAAALPPKANDRPKGRSSSLQNFIIGAVLGLVFLKFFLRLF